MSTQDNLQIDTADAHSGETYTTPVSPLSPQDKSPASASNSHEQQDESTTVHEMQSLIQSSADLSFPLEDSWAFWFFKNDRQCEWKDNLIQITTVSTVEKFWSVYNHLQVASRIGQGCDYLLFKTHIVSENISCEQCIDVQRCPLATDVGRPIQSFRWSMVDQFE